MIPLETYINHLRQAVCLVSPFGTVLHFNPAFASLFNREMAGGERAYAEVFKHNPDILGKITASFSSRGSVYLRDVKVAAEFKSDLPMDVEIVPLIGGDNEVIAISLLFRDRSGMVKFEEHQKKADRLHSLALISSGLAHEIKNPLSGIKGAAQLLQREVTGELQEYAAIIAKEVKRVDGLVKELLGFAKQRVLSKEPVNLNQILHDILVLQQTFDRDRIQIGSEFDPSLPLVSGDDKALTQIFLNLIQNARQAIVDKGSVTIKTRVITDYGMRLKDKKRMLVAVEVSDTGGGIPADKMASIFIPFFTTKSDGSGLGLSICQKIITEHDGDIEIQSEEGKGTLVRVVLPAAG